jgi:hypothetical protein
MSVFKQMLRSNHDRRLGRPQNWRDSWRGRLRYTDWAFVLYAVIVIGSVLVMAAGQVAFTLLRR